MVVVMSYGDMIGGFISLVVCRNRSTALGLRSMVPIQWEKGLPSLITFQVGSRTVFTRKGICQHTALPPPALSRCSSRRQRRMWPCFEDAATAPMSSGSVTLAASLHRNLHQRQSGFFS